jgi:hypothetical protein
MRRFMQLFSGQSDRICFPATKAVLTLWEGFKSICIAPDVFFDHLT